METFIAYFFILFIIFSFNENMISSKEEVFKKNVVEIESIENKEYDCKMCGQKTKQIFFIFRGEEQGFYCEDCFNAILEDKVLRGEL